MGLHRDPQENRPACEFAREFERKATDAGVKDEDAKATLITLLPSSYPPTILRGEVDSADLTAE